jgi:hypothetical protein
VTVPTRNPIGPAAGPLPSGPWQPIPRAAHQPSPSGLGLAVILLFWFSPISLAVWLVGQLVILVQKRWHWHHFALAALAHIGYVLAVIGPEAALRRHFYVHQHFWQYVALILGFGPKGTTLSIGRLAHDLVVTQLWLGVPVGLLAAALAVYFAEHAAAGAEWSPLVRRRAGFPVGRTAVGAARRRCHRPPLGRRAAPLRGLLRRAGRRLRPRRGPTRTSTSPS